MPKQSHRSNVSNGQLLVAMILNGLGFVSRTLHMYPEYLSDKPTERLLGEGILSEHINDDVMGRFLDASISKATERAVKSFKKLCRQVFACEINAQKALVQWQASEPFKRIHEAQVMRHEKRANRGRPGASDDVVVTLQITGQIATSLRAKEEAENLMGFLFLVQMT